MTKRVKWSGTLALSAAMLFSATAIALPPAHSVDELPILKPEKQHTVATHRVARFFTRDHFKQMELDNALSKLLLVHKQIMLDYNKMFCLAEDIKRAKEYILLFDKIILTGKLRAADALNHKSLQRRFEM